ncbi:MAG: CPBP family intramembrane glutamic endopeptidase [Armatimonadota bacterium]|nr:CPBP family intramembrane metalloprotease [Armatimonadota bacterium]MDW8103905.1 CPBP family intramembrane glutamic endopeptidase [Armatimonadota bacterium]
MRRLVFTLFWLESALAATGFGLLAVRAYIQKESWSEYLYPTWRDTALGALLALLMLALALAGSFASERWAAWAFLKRWMLQIAPLFATIRLREMVLLAVVAGFGEEVLFRGVLQPVSGIWLASLLFAVVHVLRWDSDGIKMMLFYLPFGLLLGGLYAFTGNLWGSCVAHTLYDLIALWWMQHLARR